MPVALDRLHTEQPCTQDNCTHPKPQIVTDLDEVYRLLSQHGTIASDIENTTSSGTYSPFLERIECVSYYIREIDVACWVPFIGPTAVPLHKFVSKFRDLHEDPDRAWIYHNGKHDLKFKWRIGLIGHPLLKTIIPRGRVIDTCICSRLLNENLPSQGLKALVKMPESMGGFGHTMKTYKEVKETRDAQFNIFMSQEQALKEYKDYSCEDSIWGGRLWHDELEPRLEKEPKLKRLFHDLECRVSKALMDAELRGVLMDVPYLNGLRKGLEADLEILKKDIYTLARRPFDIMSPEQVSRLLFEELNIGERGKLNYNKGAKGKKDWVSTDGATLERYLDVPIVEKIDKFRELEKLRGTYLVTLIDYARQVDGRIRTTFNQVPDERYGDSAVTGRLSSSGPGLQQIPRRSKEGKKIRKGFVAPERRKLIVGDNSQIELRFLAHITQDDELLRAYRRWDCGVCGEHGYTNKAYRKCPECGAAEIGERGGKRDKKHPKQPVIEGFCIGLDLHTITALACNIDREKGKIVNFALDFGMGKEKFSAAVKMPRKQSDPIREAYFKKYRGVTEWFKEVTYRLRKDGYVTTVLGRKRRFPELKGQRVDMFGREWRQAANAWVQGSAADYMKVQLRNLYEGFAEMDWLEHTFLTLTVHDEFVVETDEERVPEVQDFMYQKLENAFEVDVPLLVAIGSGYDWGSAKA